MDWSRNFFYFPVTAIVNCLFLIAWNKFVSKKDISHWSQYFFWFVSSLFTTWGVDVLQAQFEAHTKFHVLKISLGIWILFIFTYHLKFKTIKNWSKQEFKETYLGEILSLFVIGLTIFVLT